MIYIKEKDYYNISNLYKSKQYIYKKNIIITTIIYQNKYIFSSFGTSL